jgi:serine/threonine protein kinase
MAAAHKDPTGQPTQKDRHLPVIPDFALLRTIGRGSYGEVWLASSVTGAFRAIKIVRRGQFESERDFEREFHGIEAFEPVSRSHPNLLQVLHVGRNDAAGYYFYVMELADDDAGAPISDATVYTPRTLRSVVKAGSRLQLPTAVRIVRQLAAGLSHLHSMGLVHRDIKPSNIVFVEGVAKLGDAGLVSGSREDMSSVGTPGYVPPEGTGKPQADVYGLGKVLYEIITGRTIKDFPEVPTDLPAMADKSTFTRLNSVVLRACDPDPGRRFETAAQFLTALDNFEQKNGETQSAPRIFRKQALLWMAAFALILLLCLALLGTVMSRHSAGKGHDERNAPPPTSSPITLAETKEDGPLSNREPDEKPSPATATPVNETNGDRGGPEGPVPTKTVTTEGANEFLRP